VSSYGNVVRRRVFGYDLPGVSYTTQRSRLAWTRLFGGDCNDAEVAAAGPSGNPAPENCTALAAETFEYRDPNDVSGGGGVTGQWIEEPGYRMPSLMQSRYWAGLNRAPEFFGDINGDGLVDRIWGTDVLINTGSGFELDAEWTARLGSIQYEHPKMQVTQVQANDPAIEVAVTLGICDAILSQDLRTFDSDSFDPRGPGAVVSTGARSQNEQSPGTPLTSSIEASGRLFLEDIDADGRADLVLSLRLSGVHKNVDCNGNPRSQPWPYQSGETVSIVFRNTGDPATGWVRDPGDPWAKGLPAFEEVAFESTYFTERQRPIDIHDSDEYGQYFGTFSVCNARGLRGDRTDLAEDLCVNLISFHPRFVDLNGDGYKDLIVLERDDPTSRSLWLGDNLDLVEPSEWGFLRSRAWIQDPDAEAEADRWVRDSRFDLPDLFSPYQGVPGWGHVYVENRNDPAGGSEPWWPSSYPVIHSVDTGAQLADLNRDGLTDVVWKSYAWDLTTGPPYPPVAIAEGVLLNMGATGSASSAWCASDPAMAELVGGHCGGAAAYLPPYAGLTFLNFGSFATSYSTGHLADLNGDGWLDFLHLDLVTVCCGPDVQAWLYSPGDPGDS